MAMVTEAELARETMRKVSVRLIPFLFVLYIVSYLDRTNVGLAALQMNRDLGFSAAVYGFGAGIFFIGYAAFEVPSNLILARVGARRWIARIAVTWGALACAMLLVRGPRSFYGIRLLLGIAEAGYFPGIIYYLCQWFPERERGRAIARFMIAIPLSIVVGGPVGGMLLTLEGHLGLAGWQWLFLLEGVPAVILGIAALLFLTDRPADATWLSSAEREWLRSELAREQRDAAAQREPTIRKGLTNGPIWWLSLPYVIALLGWYALTLWGPLLLKDLLQVSDQRVGLTTGLIGAAGVIGMLLNGSHSDRTDERVMHSAIPLLVMAIGLALGAVLDLPAVAVTGFAVAAFGYNAFLPAFWCLPSAFVRGSAAAAAIALINSVGSLGGFIGPYALGAAKTATGSFSGGLVTLACLTALAAALIVPVRRLRALRPPMVDLRHQ
jgi:MFS transporter, ACS family, tartrate transporter